MNTFKDLSISQILVLLPIVCVLFFIMQYNWKRRWLYYYASKYEGPTSWPLIGSAHLFVGTKGIYKILLKLCETYNTIFKVWLGRDLVIINSRPEDIEILFNTHVERAPQFKYLRYVIGDGILAGTSKSWRPLRKMVNPAFRSNILESFFPVIAKYSTKLVENLKSYTGQNIDLSKHFFKCTLDIACENIVGVKSDLLTGEDKFMNGFMRIEDIIFDMVLNVSLNPKYIWKAYHWFKEIKLCSSEVFQFVRKVIQIRRSMISLTSDNEDNFRLKQVFDYLHKEKEKNKTINDKTIENEIVTFLVATSETTAYTMYYCLLVLGMYPEIQKRVHEEIDSILRENQNEMVKEDIAKMNYLERVIKETMRMIPTIPFVARHIEQDVEINSNVYPKGSTVFVPIAYLNRRPDLWENPLKFDPDRFLPEKSEKRHRCTFIPFSYGPRNCIGLRYAMMSMKVILSTVLRHYTISTVDYKSIHDISFKFGAVLKPESSCKIFLKERKD